MNRKIVTAGLVGLVICLVLVGIVGRSKKGARKRFKSEAEALYQLAVTHQSKGEADKGEQLFTELIKRFPQDELVAQARFGLGEIYERQGLWQKAADAYTKIVDNSPNFKQISEVEERIWDLHVKILFTPVVTEKDITYKVEPGDTLGKIAAKFNTTVELIKRSNNLTSDLIRPGKRLKISAVKFSVIIDKSQNSLSLKEDDQIFKVYTVATGKYNSTPTGNFSIAEKLKNPPWYKSGEGIIPSGSPKNVLGTRWLGLSEPQYGIHGGASPEDLEKQVTDGCIRMTNSDVEELFTILPRKAEVTIVD